MNFYGIRELSNNTKGVLSTVAAGKKVIITDNGKPAALMLHLTEDNFEEMLMLAQRLEAQTALVDLQRQAEADFPMGLSDEEIQAEIDATRRGD